MAQKKAIFESLATDNLSSVSTSSIEFSTAPSYRSADFSDRKIPFTFTSAGYKTLIDKNTQTEMDLGVEKVGFRSSILAQHCCTASGGEVISRIEEKIL